MTRDEKRSEVDGISVDGEFKKLVISPLSEITSEISEDKRQPEWGILLELAGLEDSKHIVEFMSMLDEKTAEAHNMKLNDVDDILSFFKDRDWKVKGANPQSIRSFHNWFCALYDCLERFGTKL